MQRLDGGAAPPHLAGGIVALGNFDGFHLGHQAVVGLALVATFDPHPRAFFRPDAAPFRLTTLGQRLRLFEAAGADAAVVFGFDDALAALTPEAFVSERLVRDLAIAGVVTGEDFAFGRAKGGDVGMLAELGRIGGFRAEAVPPVSLDGAPVSSTRIRALLREGRPAEAAQLLTRPFAIEGEVVHGDKVGRTIGYPTANLELRDYMRPAYGIYAVRGRLADGRVLDGAANLGVRPQFEPPKELLEPFFFDFDGDLYGRRIAVELVEFLRPEARFDGLDALVRQMDADCERARAVLAAE